MRTTKKLLGERIKELRKSRKLSQDRLSEQVGIDPKHLSRIEVGNSYPSLNTLEKIAIALNVGIKEFFEFEHLSGRKDLINNAVKLLKDTDEERVKLISKVIRAIGN
ncbi:MAG: helix-turn-helix transcriptional regulator [Nitrospirota bacterium]|nr:helix-turn-helix transcriptional regulator [Nitrospirota bacterium]